jgi:3-deoxy-D-manno-octulosonic-acid transferase
MSILYNLAIFVYHLLIIISSLFNSKARLWLHGRRNLFRRLSQEVKNQEDIIWFHAASLGEFEQGRPVIEAFRKKYPSYKILLTFFSPSGYEIRKNYEGADYIYYLPLDTEKNAERFIQLVKPRIAVFVKYEFWFNYINILYQKQIPTFIISAIFRKEQHFFKWYGSWFRKMLKKITFFFVQNDQSLDLLKSIGIEHAMKSGDTRFDRVLEIAKNKKSFPLVEKFTTGHKVLLAGSSWAPDEELIQKITASEKQLKIIIAPHEIHEEHIVSIEKKFSKNRPLRYSLANEKNILQTNVIIIDGMGFLSSLYQYCDIAFIGGGFGKAIHNILEAVTFGKPVIFGPVYHKFKEAVDLIQLGGAFTVANENEFIEIFTRLMTDQEFYLNASGICKKFVEENIGATELIIGKLSENV